jgi:GWxTD domain-containing protein
MMKRLLGMGLLLALLPGLRAQELKLYTDICRFQELRSGEHLLQIYVAVGGASVVFRQEPDSLYQACVNIQMHLLRLQGGDTMVQSSDVYNLSLPADARLRDTTLQSRRRANPLNVHQLRLEPGQYILQTVATDSNAQYLSRAVSIHEFVLDPSEPQAFAFSDVKWVAGVFKADVGRRGTGRDELIPFVTNATFVNEDSMAFYQELYNTDQLLQENFLIRCVIYQGDNRLWNYETRGQARAPGRINAYKEVIYIGNLSSNIYYLQVELINSKNRPVRTFRQKFYVYNSRKETEFELVTAPNQAADFFDQYDEERLDYYLQTLAPRATSQEINLVQVLPDFETKKNFLYTFFERRRSTPDQQVEALWRGHLLALDYVNQHFTSRLREGWRTDRGRIFMQYGIPNDVERFPSETGLLPYEIWRYNRLGPQTNVVFIFYDPDLATQEYPLLHSTKYGELSNPAWQRALIRGASQGIDFEEYQNAPYLPKLRADE